MTAADAVSDTVAFPFRRGVLCPLMGQRGRMALRIAHAADLILMPVRDTRRVRQIGPVLEVGRNACPDTVVTIACRHRLAMRGVFAEAEVVELVRRYGYTYMPLPRPRALGPRAARGAQRGARGRGVKEPSCA